MVATMAHSPRLILALAAFVFGTVLSVRAGEPSLKVERAWMQAVPPGTSDTAIFMRLTNTGKTALRLVGGETPIASMVHPMVTAQTAKGGHAMAGMEDAPALEIPAGGTLVLQPGGNHLMVMGLKQHPKPGETVPLTIRVEPGNQQVTLNLQALLAAPK